MKESIEIFQIRTKSGLFSSGGIRPSFKKKGKAWYKLTDVLRHLAELDGLRREEIYKGCVITSRVYELRTQIDQPIENVLSELTEKENKKMQKREADRRAYIEREELAELERLKAKYSNVR
jgi:hypothetical protein